MASEPLFYPADVAMELAGFVAAFLVIGASSFRFFVLGFGLTSARRTPDGGVHRLADAAVFARCASRAAGLGLAGAVIGAGVLAVALAERAQAKHLTFVGAAVAGGPPVLVQAASLSALVVSLFIAWRVSPRAWGAAGVATVAFALRSVTRGKWAALVNPLHVLGGSLWIGTLFFLVVCGLVPIVALRAPGADDGAATEDGDPERTIAALVQRFSRVALASAAMLVATGAVTAWTHLKYVAALWTTPYGYALLAKLGVVGVVLALGAWNWRRVGPALGRAGTGRTLVRTATGELAAAGVVLVLTAVLVSLPTPELP